MSDNFEKMTRKQLIDYVVENKITYGNRGPMANKPILKNTNKNKAWLLDAVQKWNDAREVPAVAKAFNDGLLDVPTGMKRGDSHDLPRLTYKDAKSDKEYRIRLIASAPSLGIPWMVRINYGKTGSNLREQDKMFKSKAEAVAFARKKWLEKNNKGYTAEGSMFDSKRSKSKADRQKKLRETTPEQPRIMKGKATAPKFLEQIKAEGKFKEGDWWISEKFDGLRAVWDGKKFVTKNGEDVDAPEWFTRELPKIALDGELFVGRNKLEEANSIVRTRKESKNYDADRWEKITYVVFDSPDLYDESYGAGTFEDVYYKLAAMIGGNDLTYPGHELILAYPYATLDRTTKDGKKAKSLTRAQTIDEMLRLHPQFIKQTYGSNKVPPVWKLLEDYEKYAKSYWKKKNWRQKASMAKKIGWQVSDDGVNWKISMTDFDADVWARDAENGITFGDDYETQDRPIITLAKQYSPVFSNFPTYKNVDIPIYDSIEYNGGIYEFGTAPEKTKDGEDGDYTQAFFTEFRDFIIDTLDGEGAMIRDPDSQYQATRTSSLKKLKKAKDEDGLVVGYEEGLNRNEGKVGSLIIKMRDGQTFKLGAGLTDADREKPPAKNTMVEYSYLGRTNSGKPRHAAYLRPRPDLLDKDGNPPYTRRLQRALQSRRIDKTYYRRLAASHSKNQARAFANAIRRRGFNARVIHTKTGGHGIYIGNRRMRL
tara:strand:- start:17111 stop:19234 length:2124 start_codon:yes stop_codon:yes gene_type:complete